MIFKNLANYINKIYIFLETKFHGFYLNSNVYDNKISRVNNKNLEYRPSPILLDCLIKNKSRKNKIDTSNRVINEKNTNITFNTIC